MSEAPTLNKERDASNDTILKFQPFCSLIRPTFWHAFHDLKLNHHKLSNPILEITGFYAVPRHPAPQPTLLSLSASSFSTTSSATAQDGENQGSIPMPGVFMNFNTLQGFKDADKKELVKNEILRRINESDGQPWFGMFVYADLKTFRFVYWFAFPCQTPASPFILVSRTSESLETVSRDLTLDRPYELAEEDGKTVVYFNDPSTTDFPGWPLRQILFALHRKRPRVSPITVKCIRNGVVKILQVKTLASGISKSEGESDWITGWERNDKGQLTPMVANLASVFDQKVLARSAAELNVKLMKWQVFPGLQFEKLAGTRVLILGAGTLGCTVARTLLGWGITTLALVDNGLVSLSNPPRQSLYSVADVRSPKATTAAQRLLDIYPSASIRGIRLTIPMPGHQYQSTDAFKTLRSLIAESDVVILAVDSREGRWLPTVLGKREKKIVVNAALGFDSFLVMRHHDEMGCYFCNDVVGPRNTVANRTLDQQCTVTRPGLSPIASGIVVEMISALLHHPLGRDAPAQSGSSDSDLVPANGGDGKLLSAHIPHQIRGFLNRFDFLQFRGQAFESCVACSPKIVYHERQNDEAFDEFLRECVDKPWMPEEISGVTALLARATLGPKKGTGAAEDAESECDEEFDLV